VVTEEGPRFRRSAAGATALTLLALGLGGWGVVNSPLFETRHVVVRGNGNLTAAQIIDAAGVRTGDNLMRLSLDAVAGRVERLPWVADAAAGRDLPSTLVLRVVERTAVGRFAGPAGGFLVARDGTVLGPSSEPPSELARRLPVLGEWDDQPAPGNRLPAAPATLRVATSMDVGLLRRISAASGSGGEVVLELRDGGTVRYGAPTALPRKNLELARLLRWVRGQGLEIETIDLRVPGAPTLDPVGEEGSSPSPSP
jgi:cell division protein FtsQ